MTREERVAMLKAVSEKVKAGEIKGVQAVSVLRKEYSIFNQCFLAAQEAPAGVFGGYQQWRSLGRKVKKGEHGYSIVFPMQKKEEDQRGLEEKPRFSCATVFHFDQTEEVEKEVGKEETV